MPIRLKKTYLLKLDLILFQTYMTQVKVNLSSTLVQRLTHISLCLHLKEITTSQSESEWNKYLS
jgi:hypothetical protein